MFQKNVKLVEKKHLSHTEYTKKSGYVCERAEGLMKRGQCNKCVLNIDRHALCLHCTDIERMDEQNKIMTVNEDDDAVAPYGC